MEDVHSGKQRTVVLCHPVGEEYYSDGTAILKVKKKTKNKKKHLLYTTSSATLNTARQNIDIFT